MVGKPKSEAREGCGEGQREEHSGWGTECAGSLGCWRTESAQASGSCPVGGSTGSRGGARSCEVAERSLHFTQRVRRKC